MNKISGWALAIYVLGITGVAAYEYAVIERLQWVIQILTYGNSH